MSDHSAVSPTAELDGSEPLALQKGKSPQMVHPITRRQGIAILYYSCSPRSMWAAVQPNPDGPDIEQWLDQLEAATSIYFGVASKYMKEGLKDYSPDSPFTESVLTDDGKTYTLRGKSLPGRALIAVAVEHLKQPAGHGFVYTPCIDVHTFEFRYLLWVR